MKKVSTRAAAQSRDISQQKLTIGLDLGDRNSWYCVVDEAGQIQLEQRVRTNAKVLQEVFAAMPRSRRRAPFRSCRNGHTNPRLARNRFSGSESRSEPCISSV